MNLTTLIWQGYKENAYLQPGYRHIPSRYWARCHITGPRGDGLLGAYCCVQLCGGL